MDVIVLSDAAKNLIKNSYSINNISRCVNELVLNAIDANASDIAVKINIESHRIEVIDNGSGISPTNLENIGHHYATNKILNGKDLEKCGHYFGYKGESLANIIDVSGKVIICSRAQCANNESIESAVILKAYKRTFDNNQIRTTVRTNARLNVGTTVIIEDFMGKLPARQKRPLNIELNAIKNNMEAISVMHPEISFTLTDNTTKQIIYAGNKMKSVEDRFLNLMPNLRVENLVYIKAYTNKSYKVFALISNIPFESPNYQYLFVNKQHVNCKELVNITNEGLVKKASTCFHPFVINIQCPRTHFEFLNGTDDTPDVVFIYWDKVTKLIEKLKEKFREKREKTPKTNEDKVMKSKPKSLHLGSLNGVIKADDSNQNLIDIDHMSTVKPAEENVEVKDTGSKENQSYGIEIFDLPSKTRSDNRKRSADKSILSPKHFSTREQTNQVLLESIADSYLPKINKSPMEIDILRSGKITILDKFFNSLKQEHMRIKASEVRTQFKYHTDIEECGFGNSVELDQFVQKTPCMGTMEYEVEQTRQAIAKSFKTKKMPCMGTMEYEVEQTRRAIAKSFKTTSSKRTVITETTQINFRRSACRNICSHTTKQSFSSRYQHQYKARDDFYLKNYQKKNKYDRLDSVNDTMSFRSHAGSTFVENNQLHNSGYTNMNENMDLLLDELFAMKNKLTDEQMKNEVRERFNMGIQCDLSRYTTLEINRTERSLGERKKNQNFV